MIGIPIMHHRSDAGGTGSAWTSLLFSGFAPGAVLPKCSYSHESHIFSIRRYLSLGIRRSPLISDRKSRTRNSRLTSSIFAIASRPCFSLSLYMIPIP